MAVLADPDRRKAFITADVSLTDAAVPCSPAAPTASG